MSTSPDLSSEDMDYLDDTEAASTIASTADDYGALLANIEDYFPGVNNPQDRSAEFISEYRDLGEAVPRFKGIEKQLERAIQRPAEFAEVLRDRMGYPLTSAECREYMLDLHSQLFDSDEELVRAKTDPDALFAYTAGRRVRLPFTIPRIGSSAPLWLIALTLGLIAFIGWLGVTYVDLPVLNQVFFALLFLGTVGVALAGAAMLFLRDEVLNSERYAERQEALQAYRAAKADKRQTSKVRLPRLRK